MHIRSGGCFFGGRSVKGIVGTRTFDNAVCKEGIKSKRDSAICVRETHI